MQKALSAGMGLILALAAPAQADVITDWNVIARQVMEAAKAGGNPAARSLAMVHVAMSDAVQSAQGGYSTYVVNVPSRPSISPEAAAAAAAKSTLMDLYPAQRAQIQSAYDKSLQAVPDGVAKTDGIALGEQCAAAVHADRSADGTQAPDTYRPIATPGVWIPTTTPLFAAYARAKPWVLANAEQFRPGPPPDLTSALYARDYNETKDLGGMKSAKRTPAQTDAVKFWTQANLVVVWQDAALQLSAAKGLSLAENARLFALLNMGLANTFITDWDAKFTYNYWRPVTAIRNGDQDGNDATERDAGWTSLNAAPMHPEYPSQAAIMSGLAIGILESIFGPSPATAITATDVSDPKQQRRFASIRELADEHGNVRVWGGIHFRNSLDVGYDMGQKIAAYLIANSIKPTS